MLHKISDVVSPKMFALIQQLQSFDELNGFYLVGGTALALQIGHRNSVDIDLFSQTDFNYELLTTFLKSNFSYAEKFVAKNTIIGFIDNIKVDFIAHPYEYVNPPFAEEKIKFLSKEDIAAMKLNAIINSGQRLKDFVDVYFLLEYFSVENMLTFFKRKYPNKNPLIALRALSYFNDIDENSEPPKLIKPVSINKIKKRIVQAVTHTHKVFS